MKKKIALTALAFTLVFGVACGGGGSVENAEYEEYATQVRTVMYDLGLTTEKPATDSEVALVQAQTLLAGASDVATFDNHKSALLDLGQNFAGKTERDTLSAYTNVFEQSFYIPLIMGKALADHYKVETFYGVCANSPWNQYVQTLKDGNVKTTSVYTPTGEVFEKETFIQMALDYTNEDEYEIRVTQFSYDYSRVFFTYIDGDLYWELSYEEGNAESCYLSYSTDGFNGWNCKDENLALQAKNLIQDEFTRVDQGALRQIKENAKYTVDEEKWEEASAVFLSDGGDGQTQIPYGWADENQTVLASYRCFETTKRIEIPARVRYLANDFSISYDEGVEPTEELFIPKTVIGIKGYNQADNPNPNPSPDAGMPSLIDLTAKDLRIQTWNWQPLNNIIVEDGSTLFMAGEGHLRALDGEVVCYLNQAHPTGKIDQTEFMPGGKLTYDLLQYYPLLTASITEMVGSESGEIGDLVRMLPALRKLHVTFPDPVGEEMRGLQLECTGDLELYLHAKGAYNIDFMGAGTLTVRLDNKDVSLRINARNSVVYSKWNKAECEFLEALGSPVCVGATTIHYEDADDSALKGISFSQEWYGLEAVLDTAQANSFIVPQECFGYDIQYVKIENSVNTPVRVTLSNKVRELRINNTWEEDGKKNYGSNITVEYDGEKSAFMNVLIRSYESPQYIQAVCSDYTGKISGFVQKVTLVNETASINETYYLFASADLTITSKKVVPSYDECKRYYYTDENGNRYNVTNASSAGGTLTVTYTTFDDPADVTLTYHEEDATLTLIIVVEVPDIGGTSVYADTVYAGTRVYVEDSGIGKLIITIVPASVGDQPPQDNVVREVIMPTGTIYKGESEYIINEDTTLTLYVR